MSHSFSWVTFFTNFCTLLHSFIALVPRHNLTQVSNWFSCIVPQSCSWVFLYPVLYSFSSLACHYCPYRVWALLSILSLALLLGNILALLFGNDGGFRHLNSVALLFILLMTLLSLPYTFFLYIFLLNIF